MYDISEIKGATISPILYEIEPRSLNRKGQLLKKIFMYIQS